MNFFRPLHVETLEERALLTLTTQLVADVNVFPRGLESSGTAVEMAGIAYFGSGARLWKSDGTDAGTVLVKEIAPSQLINVNGTLFFIGEDENNGPALWKSDGTSAGSVLVKDIRAGDEVFLSLLNVNGTLFFHANDGATGFELWKSDGTAAGTVLVKDINPANVGKFHGSHPIFLTNVNGTLFFRADDGTNGDELWKSDGTEAGTVLVKDIDQVNAGGSIPRYLTNVNGTLFFSARDGLVGYELWKSDGTETGTVLVKDIRPAGKSYPRLLTNVSGTLFFGADDGTNGEELWKSDGTADGTVLLKDIGLGAAGFGASHFTGVNGTLFFTAFAGTTDAELWKSDGTEDGTVLLKDVFARESANVNGTLFFYGSDGVSGGLWKSDGTDGGTAPVKDFDEVQNLANVNGKLFFQGTVADRAELWHSDGTTAGTSLLFPDSVSTHSSSPYSFTLVGGLAFFTADDGLTGPELWKSDGTAAGTVLVKDIRAGSIPIPNISPIMQERSSSSPLTARAAASCGRAMEQMPERFQSRTFARGLPVPIPTISRM